MWPLIISNLYVNVKLVSHVYHTYQANNTGANRKVGEAISSSFTSSDALITAIEDVYYSSKVKV